jgi:hypothetical protein
MSDRLPSAHDNDPQMRLVAAYLDTPVVLRGGPRSQRLQRARLIVEGLAAEGFAIVQKLHEGSVMTPSQSSDVTNLKVGLVLETALTGLVISGLSDMIVECDTIARIALAPILEWELDRSEARRELLRAIGFENRPFNDALAVPCRHRRTIPRNGNENSGRRTP